MAKSKKNDIEKDPRIKATESIMGMSVALLAVCIPLVVVLRSPQLAFVVVGSAGIAVASVWAFGRQKAELSQSKEAAELKATIQDLQERLENVEVINRYESALAEKSLAMLDGERGAESPKSKGPLAEE